MNVKRVAVLGSTGSIGRQALSVISAQPELCACALSACSRWELLAQQAHQFRPEVVALSETRDADALREALPNGTELLAGPDAMTELVRRTRPDTLLNGVVGAAGLRPTLEAIACGSALAIANKETLVMAGAIVLPAAKARNVPVLPVDSEHSAIFQCLQAGRRDEVRRVILTASGGALRDWDAVTAASARVEDALKHPTWQMGPKITIDSATLMNKALEIVEAHWLFGLPAEQIDVVIHPESIIHSFVEFCDGSVLAQMGMPDMAMPIAYALGYPHRPRRPVAALDLAALGTLSFRPLNGRFRQAVALGYEVIRKGGLAGAVLNAANEAAVEAFLHKRISLGRVVPMVEEIVRRLCPVESPGGEVTLGNLLAADAQARAEVASAIAEMTNLSAVADSEAQMTKE